MYINKAPYKNNLDTTIHTITSGSIPFCAAFYQYKWECRKGNNT